jgi:hypothetical protein
MLPPFFGRRQNPHRIVAHLRIVNCDLHHRFCDVFTAWCRIEAARAAVVVLIVIVATGSYRRVERAAIAMGLFELAFLVVAWAAGPQTGAMLGESVRIPWTNSDYLYLVAANIGAVIMPWMIFYQQSAIDDKKFRPAHFKAARWSARSASGAEFRACSDKRGGSRWYRPPTPDCRIRNIM